MHLAQFGSSTAVGFKPVWLAGAVELRVDHSPAAASGIVPVQYGDFGIDAFGSSRSPMEASSLSAQGTFLCTSRRTLEEWEREVSRHIGRKDWLVGYRGQSCQCGRCAPPVQCCHVCRTPTAVAWYAKRTRLRQVQLSNDNHTGQRWGLSALETTLTFEADTHWLRMTPHHWAWGVPAARAINPADACDPASVTEAAWPCNLPLCGEEPRYRFYKRLAQSWIETYCVGYWEPGGWRRAMVGTPGGVRQSSPGDVTIFVEGDTFPLVRWAFTNFTWLQVTICSPSGQESSFTIETLCGEPQYVLVDPRYGAEMRYCPLHDDQCLHTPPTAELAGIASVGAPVPITERTTPLVGRLWPGRNVVRFTGFRLPGHVFHYSYDIIFQYV